MTWIIDITAPNGAKGQLSVNDDVSDEELAGQIKSLIATAKDHDPEQMTGIAGIAPPAQERRKP